MLFSTIQKDNNEQRNITKRNKHKPLVCNMFLSADYQRQKLKMDRLQNRVRKSEMARKELESKLRRMMKERDECEKSVRNKQRSKYSDILEQDQKRFHRNSDLLHLIDRIDGKAAALAARTERCKMLKAQHEQLLIRRWNQNFHSGLAVQPIKIVPVPDVPLLSTVHDNPSQNYIFKHHPASNVIITEGYGRDSISGGGIDGVASNIVHVGNVNGTKNNPITINNENNKQSKVIKYNSSMNEMCAGYDEINLNAGVGVITGANGTGGIGTLSGPMAMHLYPTGVTATAQCQQQSFTPNTNTLSIATAPESYYNRIATQQLPQREQKPCNEQVYHYLQPNDGLVNVVPTTIYTHFDGPRYAQNPVSPVHQLMRELIISPHKNKSGLSYNDARIQNINEIAVQPDYQYNIRQLPTYNKPFGSSERIDITDTNASMVMPGLRALLFGNKHAPANDGPIIDEVRQKTEAFNNRLHEYAKFKEHLPECKLISSSRHLNEPPFVDYLSHKSLNEMSNRSADRNDEPYMLPTFLASTSNMNPISDTSRVTSTVPPQLENIPENDKINKNNNNNKNKIGNENFAITDKTMTQTIPTLSIEKPSFTLDSIFKYATSGDNRSMHTVENIENQTESKAACNTLTPTATTQRTLAFDLTKNATYPFTKDENVAYLEDIDDDNRSEDSIEAVEKKIETLKLAETTRTIPEPMARKLSLIDSSKPNSRRTSIQEDEIAIIDGGTANKENVHDSTERIEMRRQSLSRLEEQPEEAKTFLERKYSTLPPKETATTPTTTTEMTRNAVQISSIIDRNQEVESDLNSIVTPGDVTESVDSKPCLYKHDSKDELKVERTSDDKTSTDATYGNASEENDSTNQYYADINQSQTTEHEMPQVYSTEQQNYQQPEGNYQDQQYYYEQNDCQVDQPYYDNQQPKQQYDQANTIESDPNAYTTAEAYNEYQYTDDTNYAQGSSQNFPSTNPTFQQENEQNYQENTAYGQQDISYQPQDSNYTADNTEYAQKDNDYAQQNEQYNQGEYQYETAPTDDLNVQYTDSNGIYQREQLYQQEDPNYQYQETSYQHDANYQQGGNGYDQNNYYNVEPGENYYTQNEQGDGNGGNYQNTYADPNNTDSQYYTQLNPTISVPNGNENNAVANYTVADQVGDESSTSYSENVYTPTPQLPPQDQAYINQTNTTAIVTNYLQSDTDESAALSYPNQNQHDESDFDFSLKS